MPIDQASGLFFESAGPLDGPTIVFLHGGGVAGWMWVNQVREFQSHYRCLVPDLPEQGESFRAGNYSPGRAAECVAGLIRGQVTNGRAIIVGLSEGAQVAVALLANTPEVVERAFISSAILRPLPGAGINSRGVLAWTYRLSMAPLKNSDWWIQINMKGSAGLPDAYFPQFKKNFQAMTESGLVNMLFESMQFRLPAGLEVVHVPALVLAGKNEYRQMKESAADLMRALPEARGYYFSLGPGSSLRKEHNWALTAPAQFNETLHAWLEDQLLPAYLEPIPV